MARYGRKVPEGILWMLPSGAGWGDLPEVFPYPRQPDGDACGIGRSTGFGRRIWRASPVELNERQQPKWSGYLLKGSLAPAKKGAGESAKRSAARGRSGWWGSTARVFTCETSFKLLPRGRSGVLSIYYVFFQSTCVQGKNL